MTLFEFIGKCFIWGLIYFAVKFIIWKFGYNYGKKQRIFFGIVSLKKEIMKSIKVFEANTPIKRDNAKKSLNIIHKSCSRVEKLFNIYMFDNRDNKRMDAIRSKFIATRKVCSNGISDVFENHTKYISADELATIKKSLQGLANMCDSVNEKLDEEIKNGHARESFKF